MELLLTKKANREAPNKLGNTPLMHAIKNNRKITTLRYLIDQGGNPNAKNHQGQTPLMLAAIKRQSNTVKTLLAKGASLKIKDRGGDNGLHYIFEYLSAAMAETIMHRFSHLITLELLNDTNKSGKYPLENISNQDFHRFVGGLTFKVSRKASYERSEGQAGLCQVGVVGKYKQNTALIGLTIRTLNQ